MRSSWPPASSWRGHASLPLICLGALVAFAVLGIRLEEQRKASGFCRGSARYAAAALVGIVVIPYAAVGMTTLLGVEPRRWPAPVRWPASGTAGGGDSAPDAEQVAAGEPGSIEHEAPGSHSTGSDSTSRDATSSDSRGTSSTSRDPHATALPAQGFADAAAANAPSRGWLPADPTGLSIDELCRAWRVSYLVLQNARAPEAAEQAVQLRCRDLDELSRRHPEGFRRWLDDGARAAGDPSRYVRGEPPRRCRDTDGQA